MVGIKELKKTQCKGNTAIGQVIGMLNGAIT
jgi:hypothetical protein